MHVYPNALSKTKQLEWLQRWYNKLPTKPAVKCSKLTTDTLEQDVKYVQS